MNSKRVTQILFVLMLLILFGFAGFGVYFILNQVTGVGFICIGMALLGGGVMLFMSDGVLFGHIEKPKQQAKGDWFDVIYENTSCRLCLEEDRLRVYDVSGAVWFTCRYATLKERYREELDLRLMGRVYDTQKDVWADQEMVFQLKSDMQAKFALSELEKHLAKGETKE